MPLNKELLKDIKWIIKYDKNVTVNEKVTACAECVWQRLKTDFPREKYAMHGSCADIYKAMGGDKKFTSCAEGRAIICKIVNNFGRHIKI